MLIAHGNDRVALEQINNGLKFFTRPFGRGQWIALKVILLERLGRHEEALVTLEEGLEVYGGVVPQHFAQPLVMLGRGAEAREILATMLPDADTGRVSNYLLFETYVALGDYDRAFDWLIRSLDVRDHRAVQWLYAPRLWGRLKAHPRMQEARDHLRTLEDAPE